MTSPFDFLVDREIYGVYSTAVLSMLWLSLATLKALHPPVSSMPSGSVGDGVSNRI
jgi:hypothetical protein